MKNAGKNSEPLFHKFPVFSILDEEDNVTPKHVFCNNCGVLHYVEELCKSSFVLNKEDTQSVRTVEDIKLSFPDKLIDVLEKYKCDISVWEEIEFMMENDIHGKPVVIHRETEAEKVAGKFITIQKNEKFKISSFDEKIIIET
ncbi:MAG: hypothetical protein ACW98X_23780 [Promethearchaeota archaeon]|jgi:ABC-type uncharacterized transport system ATPase subunit